MRVEGLRGIHGQFNGEINDHPDERLGNRCLASGTLTYIREINGLNRVVTIPVDGIHVRRLENTGVDRDFRRYIRVRRGPKGQRDNIVGLIDTD